MTGLVTIVLALLLVTERLDGATTADDITFCAGRSERIIELLSGDGNVSADEVIWTFSANGKMKDVSSLRDVSTGVNGTHAWVIIHDVTLQHAGVYTVTAADRNIKHQIRVIVAEPPAAPYDMSIDETDSHVFVTWHAGDNGSTAVSFSISLNQQQKEQAFNVGNQLQATIQKNSSPAPIKVTVYATNECGKVSGKSQWTNGGSTSTASPDPRFEDEPLVTIQNRNIIIRYRIIGHATGVTVKYCKKVGQDHCTTIRSNKTDTMDDPLVIPIIQSTQKHYVFYFTIHGINGNSVPLELFKVIEGLQETFKTQQMLLYLVAAVLVTAIITSVVYYVRKKSGPDADALIRKKPSIRSRSEKEEDLDGDSCKRSTIYEKLDDVNVYEEPPTPKTRMPAVCPTGRVPAPPPMRTTSDQADDEYLDPDDAIRKQASLMMMRRQAPGQLSQESEGYLKARTKNQGDDSDGYLTARTKHPDTGTVQDKLQRANVEKNNNTTVNKDGTGAEPRHNNRHQYLTVCGELQTGGDQTDQDPSKHYLTVLEDHPIDQTDVNMSCGTIVRQGTNQTGATRNDRNHYLTVFGDVPTVEGQNNSHVQEESIYDNDQHKYLTVFGDVWGAIPANDSEVVQPIKEAPGRSSNSSAFGNSVTTCANKDNDDYLIPIGKEGCGGPRRVMTGTVPQQHSDNDVYSGLLTERHDGEYTALKTHL